VVLAALLFGATLALSLADSARTRDAFPQRSASVYDEGSGGASILRRFLEASGVRTSTIEGDRYGPLVTDAVFVLGPTAGIGGAEVRILRSYVEGGGTLVMATDLGFSERAVLEAFGIRLGGAVAAGSHAVSHLALAAPPVRSISIDRGTGLELPSAAEPVIAAPETLVAVLRQGRGLVFVVGTLSPFLNGTIGDADNGRFALALAGAGRSVAFDEFHHGFRGGPDQFAVLFGTWPGRALLAAGAASYLYLLLSGRRLGPPVPLDPRSPRSSLDYVRGFAGLVRRSGRGEIARRRLREDLRRGAARLVGADPDAPLERILGALEPSRAAEVRALDELLRGPLRDPDLLRTVARIQEVTRPR